MAAIKFKYLSEDLTFASRREFHAWCDWHMQKLSGIAMSRNGEQASQLFGEIREAKDPQSIIDQRSNHRPPIKDEAIGRFMYALQEADPEAFKLAMGGWWEFGRNNSIGPGSNGQDTARIALIYQARAGAYPLEATYLKELIEEQKLAKAELIKTREEYELLMSVKAPADYWRSKADNHKKTEESYLKNTLCMSAIFTLMAIFLPALFVTHGFNWIARSIDGESSLSFARYTFVGLYLLLVTTGLWGLRVLVKLYLSEHHLRIDATERLTMIMTYLALTHENAAGIEDRMIVLASIFRPTADGVVKDDGIDASLPHLASRLMAK